MKPAEMKIRGSVLVVTVALLVVVGWLYSLSTARDKPLTLAVAASCDLARGDCVAGDGDRVLVASLSPRPVPVLDEVTLTLRVTGLQAGAYRARITGIEEDMGVSEAVLMPRGEGLFSGVFQLSVCLRQVMTWRIAIAAVDTQDPHQAVFLFQTRAQRPIEILE